MNYPEIILIAVGLSMDAFAVSVTLGLSVEKPSIKQYLLPGIYFGLFQAIMPLAGFYAGTLFADKINEFAHWIAFVLLSYIGVKMIKDSLAKHKNKEGKVAKNEFSFLNLLILAVATSIDALAVGITFAFFKINIFICIAIIGLTTFCLSICGVKIGNIFGARFKSKAELAGGIILIALGIKILIEHLWFQ